MWGVHVTLGVVAALAGLTIAVFLVAICIGFMLNIVDAIREWKNP